MIVLDFSEEADLSVLNSSIPWQKDILDFWEEFSSDKESIQVQTSGSTGAPKQIEISKNAFIESANRTISYFDLKKNQNALLVLPAKYIAGKMMIIRAWKAKMQLICLEPKLAYDDFPKAHFAAMTPTQCKNSLNEIHKIEKLLLGGEAVPNSLKEYLKPLPTKVFESYGMTETVSHIALKNLQNDDFFTTLEDIEISIDDKDRLVVKVPYVSEEPIVTNDLVEIKSKDTFIWLGRNDNVINSGGVKISPEIVEKKLWEEYGIESIVFGTKDKEFGEKVELIVDKEYEFKSEDWEKLQWPKAAIPKEIHYIEKFDRTENGKLDRQKTIKKVKK